MFSHRAPKQTNSMPRRTRAAAKILFSRTCCITEAESPTTWPTQAAGTLTPTSFKLPIPPALFLCLYRKHLAISQLDLISNKASWLSSLKLFLAHKADQFLNLQTQNNVFIAWNVFHQIPANVFHHSPTYSWMKFPCSYMDIEVQETNLQVFQWTTKYTQEKSWFSPKTFFILCKDSFIKVTASRQWLKFKESSSWTPQRWCQEQTNEPLVAPISNKSYYGCDISPNHILLFLLNILGYSKTKQE